MGIDKPNIRYVAHYHTPGSIEQYVQESGRAGRDGRRSDCILLFDPEDLEIQRALQARSRPRPHQLRRVAATLSAWSEEDKPVSSSAQSPAEFDLAAIRRMFPLLGRTVHGKPLV